ncbi:11959_t:CDS:2, partial [Dentiscutata heterogama]
SNYAERLNNLRKIKGMPNIFASNINDLVGMYSQPIEKVFVKDHASNFLEAFEGNLEENLLGSKEILSKFKHTFIIRNPEKSVKSFYEAANSTCKAWDEAYVPNSERYDIFFSKKVWLKDLRILHDLIKNVTGEKVVLVDAGDLVREPEKILRKY